MTEGKFRYSSDADDVREILVRDERGRVVLRVGLLVTLYFRDGHTTTARERIAHLFEDYRAICGTHLKWAHPGKGGFQRLNRPADRDPAVWLRAPGQDDAYEPSGWEFYWHGGESKEEASDFRIRAMGSDKRSGDELSFISASLPLSWYVDHEGTFGSLVVRWCQTLLPLHGYGGIGILESPRTSIAQAHGRTAYAFARRFPGLELDDPLSHVLYLKHGVKGGNWLTALADQYLVALRGAQNLSDRLGEGFEFHPYAGGTLLQAGPTPELGDVNRGITPVRLGRLMQELRRVRTRIHGGFQEFGLSREQSEDWLARFDSEE